MSDEHAALLGHGEGNVRSYINETTTRDEDAAEAAAVAADTPSGPSPSLVAILAPLSLGIFLVSLDTTIVVSTYASIGTELNQLQNTSWIATAYMLSLTCFQPLYGKLSDIFGRKACLLFAYSVFGLGSLCCGLAQTMGQLAAARALAGIGGGGMSTVGTIIVSDLVPLRERGVWQAIMNVIYATGESTGAPLGGLIADTIGWRWAFLIQAPLTFLAVVIAAFTLRLPPADQSHFLVKMKRIDFLGALLTIVATLALLVALDRGSTVSWSDPTILAALGVSLTFYLLLAFVEVRVATEPFLPSRILAGAGLLPAFLANFFTTSGELCVVFTMPLYLQAVRGFSARVTGLWILPAIAGGVSGSMAGGLAMQRTGKYWALTVGMGVVAVVSLVGIGLTTGWWVQNVPVMAAFFCTMCFGFGSGLTTNLVAIIANAGPEDQAVGIAVSYLFRSLGSVVGVSGSSAIIQSILRKELYKELPADDIDEIVRRVRESLAYVDTLPPATRTIVRDAYLFAVQHAWIFSLVAGVAVVVSAIFIKEKPLPSRKP